MHSFFLPRVEKMSIEKEKDIDCVLNASSVLLIFRKSDFFFSEFSLNLSMSDTSLIQIGSIHVSVAVRNHTFLRPSVSCIKNPIFYINRFLENELREIYTISLSGGTWKFILIKTQIDEWMLEWWNDGTAINYLIAARRQSIAFHTN